MSQPPLNVHIVWHPRFTRGQPLAEDLYRHLCHDPAQPAARALRIPVRFRSRPRNGTTVPPDIDLNAECNVVVVLIDDAMVDDAPWAAYVAKIQAECDLRSKASSGYPQHRVVPVALSESAFKLHADVADVNFLRLQSLPELQQSQVLLNGITHELARLLLNRPQSGDEQAMRAAGPAPVRIFLSHAKHGGLDLAIGIRDYVANHTQLETFFDVHDIPAGSQWRDVLTQSASGNGVTALLILQTDMYSTREWCRIEAMQAKLGWVPMVVVQATEQAELRGFPYLGNVPSVRWPAPGLTEYLAELHSRIERLKRPTRGERDSKRAQSAKTINAELGKVLAKLGKLEEGVSKQAVACMGKCQPDDPEFCRQLEQLFGPVAGPSDHWAHVIGKLLYEVLRAAYFPRWVEYVGALYRVKAPLRALPYPPELLTLQPMKERVSRFPETIFVYPEPRLGKEEVAVLRDAAPELQIMTPVRLPLLAHSGHTP